MNPILKTPHCSVFMHKQSGPGTTYTILNVLSLVKMCSLDPYSVSIKDMIKMGSVHAEIILGQLKCS